ncbi:MAG: metallophosphoesterase family protein [Halobacteriales archaeon]
MQASSQVADDSVFESSVEPKHVRIDAGAYDDIFIIGDVHGCRSELERLIETIDPDEDTLLVCVGDLVRKGPDSSGVLDLIREHPQLRAIRGNNEQKLIDDRADADWLSRADRAFMESLPVAISWDHALVVHGGIDPRAPLVAHTMDDLLTMRELQIDVDAREPYWFNLHRTPPKVFFGHTVFEAPFESRWAVGLDTGCVYGGELTAYQYTTGEYLSVPAEQTYEFRPAEKFITPHQTPGSRQPATGSFEQTT